METILNFLNNTSFNFANIRRSWRTTIMGLILIVAGFVSKFVSLVGSTTDWNGAIIPIIIGIILCFSGTPPSPPALALGELIQPQKNQY